MLDSRGKQALSCLVCGEPIIAQRTTHGRLRRFCSRACWSIRRAKLNALNRRLLLAMERARIVIDPHHQRPIFEFSEDELRVCEAEIARRETLASK